MRLFGGTCVFSLFVIFLNCQAAPQVTISQGVLEGIYLTTYKGRNITGFLGIPFARPPVGDLRFRAPQPADGWDGIFQASKEHVVCPQIDNNELRGDEDCLYLSVYTPQLPENGVTTLLPVMTFIHGGSFLMGNAGLAFAGPQYLLEHDVVLVVPNYRLDSLGFLSTGDEVAPGNYGLKDQVMALRWVQDNIKSFGGDPEQVTIFGNSAGAASVNLLALSESTQGLFSKFITQSGVANSPWAYKAREIHAVTSIALGERLNCSVSSSAMLIQCLRNESVRNLLSLEQPGLGLNWIPTDEVESEEAFLTDSPQNLIRQGRMRNVPWMCGTVRDEGLLITAGMYGNSELLESFLASFDSVMNQALKSFGFNDTTRYTEAMKSYYLNDLSANRSILLQNLTALISDMNFVFPAVDLMKKQLTIATAPSYMYSFEYRGTFSNTYSPLIGNLDIGVCHSDDIIYLFDRANSTFTGVGEEMSETDMEMVARMTELWTSFAINGTPTILNPDADVDEWKVYDESENYLRIGSNSNISLVLESALLKERMAFWKNLMGGLNTGSRAGSFKPTVILHAVLILFFTFYYA